ncbi:MAG: polysaccharide deacetylase [Candidatus Riflebacteria bacterium HGW-Riflebacteria-2]|jgi:chitin deacetylase|nr:MAG: polysaccharide deacetylase [Candidatus Riflebacteria bacterium HGW-Riflebacteria-2]
MKKKVLLLFVLVLLTVAVLWRLSSLRNFQIMGKLVTRAACSEKVVALTFDDGPTGEYTDSILTVLADYKVKATFFVTGREVEENLAPARQIVEQGHELGNHSYSHSRLIFKWPATIRHELEKADVAIRSAGYQGQINFRPPYGKKLFVLPWCLAQMGKTTVMWDIEPETFPEVAASADLIVEHVIQRVQPGSIILLHLMYKSREESRKALPKLIEALKQQGYRFATVTELLSS